MKAVSKVLILTVLAAPLAARAAETLSSPGTNVLTVEYVVGEIHREHPLLKAARATLEGMQARVPQARAWEDPRFGVDVERSGTTRFSTYTDTEWMISQTIPISGRRTHAVEVANAEAQGALADLRRRQVELGSRARVSLVRFANARAQLDLSRQTEQLLQQIVDNARLKYEAGSAMQAEVLMAETELVKLLEARRDIERQISDEQSQLNILMNRPAQSPLAPPARLEFHEFTLDLAKLQGLALAHRPELEAAQRKLDAAQARIGLAKRAWIPVPELRVEARQFNGSGKIFNEYDTGIFFNIPWVNRGKYRAAITEAEKSLEAAGHERDALVTETLGHVRDQLKKIETFHHHFTLFRDRLVPLAKQSVEAARTVYVNGKGGLLEVITALRTSREVDSLHQQHLADYLVALAELEDVLGMDLMVANTATPNK